MHARLGARLLLVLMAVAGCLGAAQGQPGLRLKMVTIRQGRSGWWSAQATYPRFLGRSPLETLATRTLQRAAAQGVAEWAAAMKDPYTFPAHDGSTFNAKPVEPYTYRYTPFVSLARPAIISVYFKDWEYSGGAHPNTYYDAYSFGMIGGTPRVLTLNDLFRRGTDGWKIVSDLAIARLKRDPEASWVQNGSVKQIDVQNTFVKQRSLSVARFVITPTALTVLIPPYAVGPYVAGSFFVKLPFSEFRGALDPAGPLESLLR